MPVQADQVKIYLTGADSDGGTQSDPNLSLGGFRSSTEFTSNTLHNLFRVIKSAEASAGYTDYRCVCLKNTSLETAHNLVAWWSAEYDPDNAQQIAYAIEVPETAALTDGSAQTVVDEITSPVVNTTNHNGTGSGISNWVTGMTKQTGVSPDQGSHDDDLDSNEIIFVWIKRMFLAGSPARSGISGTISTEWDTDVE